MEIKRLYERYERYISPGALVLGFIVDNMTLTRVDLLFDNLILLSYLTLIGICIIILNAHDAGRLRGSIGRRVAALSPFAMQFAFGGIFSGYVVFYSRSGSLVGGWPFLLMLAAFLIGNEFLRKHYQQLLFQLGVYFIAIFSFLIFSLPVLLDRIGAWIFVASGAAALVLIWLVVRLLAYVAGDRITKHRRSILATIWSIYLLFNFLYFSNMIPPLPLALKENLIAHAVSRSREGFVVSYEKPPWYRFYRAFNPTFHHDVGTPVYAFSAVFAPGNISSAIVHEWSQYDERADEWVVKSRIQYGITGGRDGGYRGYSLKHSITPGRWRVDVETARGQLLGRMKFTVVLAEGPVELVTEVR